MLKRLSNSQKHDQVIAQPTPIKRINFTQEYHRTNGASRSPNSLAWHRAANHLQSDHFADTVYQKNFRASNNPKAKTDYKKTTLGHSEIHGVKKINEKTFKKLFDPSKKTIVVLEPALQGYCDFAYMSYLQKKYIKEGMNFVFLNPYINGAHEFRKFGEKNSLYLDYGAMLGANKTVYYGRFPQAIKADMVVNSLSKLDFAKHCELQGIPVLNPTEAQERTLDKRKTRDFLIANSLDEVPYLDLEKVKEMKTEFILDKANEFACLQYSKGVVLKPVDSSNGSDVKLIETENFETDLTERIVKLRNGEFQEKFMLEPWVESFKLKAHLEYDWNLRVLVGQKGLIVTEVRVGKEGEPVNISNKKNKAEAWTQEDIKTALKESGLSDEKINTLFEKIKNLSLDLAKAFKANFLGLDLIIDKNLEPRVIEVNGINSGGIRTLSNLGKNNLERLEPYRAYLNVLASATENQVEAFEKSRTQDQFSDITIDLSFEETLEKISEAIESMIDLNNMDLNYLVSEYHVILKDHFLKVDNDSKLNALGITKGVLKLLLKVGKLDQAQKLFHFCMESLGVDEKELDAYFKAVNDVSKSEEDLPDLFFIEDLENKYIILGARGLKSTFQDEVYKRRETYKNIDELRDHHSKPSFGFLNNAFESFSEIVNERLPSYVALKITDYQLGLKKFFNDLAYSDRKYKKAVKASSRLNLTRIKER